MKVQDFKLDFGREKRLGFGEAIFCKQKSSGQIDAILDNATEHDFSFLLTHLSEQKLQLLDFKHREKIDFDKASETGFFKFSNFEKKVGIVAVVSGGTSDARIALEVIRTLEFNGVEATRVFDVGVAGLWRLMERLDEIRSHKIVVAVAGMDAALPTVLGGLYPGPLIAVPTSIGYGMVIIIKFVILNLSKKI